MSWAQPFTNFQCRDYFLFKIYPCYKNLTITNFPIEKARESVTLAKLMGKRVQCSLVPCSESYSCLCSLTTWDSAEMSPPRVTLPRSQWQWCCRLPYLWTWHHPLPAQLFPSRPHAHIFRNWRLWSCCGIRAMSLFPRWSCWCITGAAGNLSTTSWCTRLWPHGQQKKLSSGWSSWALGPLSTETGFYLKE